LVSPSITPTQSSARKFQHHYRTGFVGRQVEIPERRGMAEYNVPLGILAPATQPGPGGFGTWLEPSRHDT
jgi:hypothetical protein